MGLDGIRDGREIWNRISVKTINLGRNDKERTVLFQGSARKACRLFPRNVNVRATVALAGTGFDRTCSSIIVDPSVRTNAHTILREGAGAEMRIHVSGDADGGVTGKYAPVSVCESLRRLLEENDVFRIAQHRKARILEFCIIIRTDGKVLI